MEIPALAKSDSILTNMQRAYAREIADQAIGYLLAFTRSLVHFVLEPGPTVPVHGRTEDARP